MEEYSKRIADGHAERCPWRKSGCDGNFDLPSGRGNGIRMY